MEPRTSLQAKDYHYIKFDPERLTNWSDAFFTLAVNRGSN